MARVTIKQLLERIQTLNDDQLKAIQNAASPGMTPRVARKCEYRQEQISKLVDKLARFLKQRHIV